MQVISKLSVGRRGQDHIPFKRQLFRNLDSKLAFNNRIFGQEPTNIKTLIEFSILAELRLSSYSA